MKLKLMLLISLCCIQAFGTTLTGTLKGPDGIGINGTLYMSLSQQAALQSGGCGGPIEVVPGLLGPQAGYSVAIKVVAGALQGSPTVYGNDCMLPGGLYYNVQLIDSNGNTYFTDKWQIVGSTIDIGTIVSVVISGTTQTLGSTGFVQLVPAGTQTINQPPATYFGVNTMAVTGTLTLPDGSQCTTSGCFAFANVVQLTGSQAISGNKQFNDDLWGAATAFPASIGAPGHSFRNGYFDGTVAAGGGFNIYAFGSGPTDASYMQANLAPTTHVFTMTLYYGANQDLSGGGSVFPPSPMITYTPGSCFGVGCTPPTVLTLGGSLIPANSSFNLGSASLPWNLIEGQTIVAKGSLTVGPVGSFFNRVFSGVDIVCTGVADGWMGFRTDTQQLEICRSSTVYKVTLAP